MSQHSLQVVKLHSSRGAPEEPFAAPHQPHPPGQGLVQGQLCSPALQPMTVDLHMRTKPAIFEKTEH